MKDVSAQRQTIATVRTPERLAQQQVNYVCELVRELTGVTLNPEASDFINAKVRLAAFKLGFENAIECIEQLQSYPISSVHKQFVDELLPHETSFFRNAEAFAPLSQRVVPELFDQTRGPLNIWSAACSTGQEPFSIVLSLVETHGPAILKRVRIYASDISESVVLRARSGRFSKAEIRRGLSSELVNRYFRPVGDELELIEPLRRAVTFFVFDLRGPWNRVPTLHLVLIRNVLVYMSHSTRHQILKELRAHLADHGYVMTGTAETLHLWSDQWQPVPDIGPNWYRKAFPERPSRLDSSRL